VFDYTAYDVIVQGKSGGDLAPGTRGDPTPAIDRSPNQPHTAAMTRVTLWEGIGPERITALAQAWHDRATADPVVGHAYWRWATAHINAHPDSGRDVPDGMPFATWSDVKSM